VLVGSVLWILDAAWGWSEAGWMVQKLGSVRKRHLTANLKYR